MNAPGIGPVDDGRAERAAGQGETVAKECDIGVATIVATPERDGLNL